MTTTTVSTPPDTRPKKRLSHERESQLATARVALNLSALRSAALNGREREQLIIENRALRIEHPAIDELLGGALAYAPDFTAKEAATIVGMLGADGNPTDAFYRLAREKLDAYDTPSGKRIPRTSLDAFRERGGSR
jgi:hypothetical protein